LKLLDRNGWTTSNLVPVPLEALGDGAALAIANDQDPKALLPLQERLALIAIPFPRYSDGRGFSIARALREQGYIGTLRATGALIPDQFAFTLHVGFDEVEISDEQAARQPIGQWLQALTMIHDSYQDGVDGAVSILKRRRQAAELAA
jgi:uncharacterized protein (DUF934 family)